MLSSFTTSLRRNMQELLLALAVIAIVALLGVGFFEYGEQVLTSRLKERMVDLASVSALQFDAGDLALLQRAEDYRRPEWSRIVRRLIRIRTANRDFVFAYILRRDVTDPQKMLFVADSHCLYPYAIVDLNDDGLVDAADALITPGSSYEGVPSEAFDAYAGPLTNRDLYTDQWGTVLTGYAPIRDGDGRVAAVMALDIRADAYLRLIEGLMTPFTLLLVLLAGFLTAFIITVYVWHRKIRTWRKMDRERSELLKITFHQLGSPLTILKWSLELLLEEINSPDLRKLVSQHVHNADEVIHRMNSILEALKAAEQIHSGRMEYRLETKSLSTVIRSAVHALASNVARRNQTVELAIDATEDACKLDAALIGRVMVELLSNASDYSPAGSTISVRTFTRPGSMTVRIEDAGCGIAPADLPRLFHEFTRGANAARYKPDGNGLGLYIAKGIVERAGGQLSIVSREQRGTTVSFTLPLIR